MRSRSLSLALAGLLLASPAAAMNHLVVLLDDCGYDGFSTFGVLDAPATPNIDSLRDSGVTFRNAWTSPICGPSRASLITGRFPREHGFTWNKGPTVEVRGRSLARSAAGVGMATWHTGKWHLGDPETLPAALGFEHSVGPPGNFDDYFLFLAYRDGQPEWVEAYATTWTVDEAIAQVGAAGDGDWLGYVAFNAAHYPFHDPPCALHGYGCDPLPDDYTRYRAMIQAVDTELGRLLAAVPADTMVYLTCDNGTPGHLTSPQAPFRGGKGDPTEGGVRVPLIISGPRVAAAAAGSDSWAMAHLVDLFATVGASEGFAAVAPATGVDLTPYLENPQAPSGRIWMAGEQFGGSRFARAVLFADRWKLTWDDQASFPSFYDLVTDPFEVDDLAPGGDVSGLTSEALEAYVPALGLLSSTPRCADRADNDGDGSADLADPKCASLLDDAERRRGCGLGFEVAGVLAMLWRWRRATRRRG